jgi:hypothetical protein
MVLQCIQIGLVDTLQNIKDDACKTILVQVDFLVIRDLSDLAAGKCQRIVALLPLWTWFSYLTSAKLEGSSTVIAPPYSSTLLYDIMAIMFVVS